MPSLSDGRTFFINEFDETMDEVLLNVARSISKQKGSPLDAQLHFYINSEGGDASRAFSLVALMEHAKALGFKVFTTVLCDAHSAGSLVAVAGSPGCRKVARGANYLVHYGEVELVATGPVGLQRIFAANNRHFYRMVEHYNLHTKIPDIKSLMDYDNAYISSEEALEWRMADALFD